MAAKASENAAKLGSIATQKVSELSESVNEKVKEGTIVNDLQSQVTTIGSKVFDVGRKGFSNMFGQKMSLYEDPNQEESFDGDDQFNGYQNLEQNKTTNSITKPLKENLNLMHSSKSTPSNLAAQAISKEEQVLGYGNSRPIRKKTDEDDVWSILASDDKSSKKSSNRRK